jgi:hypothetical protein
MFCFIKNSPFKVTGNSISKYSYKQYKAISKLAWLYPDAKILILGFSLVRLKSGTNFPSVCSDIKIFVTRECLGLCSQFDISNLVRL